MCATTDARFLADSLVEELRCRGFAEPTVKWYRCAGGAMAKAAEACGDGTWSADVAGRCLAGVARRLEAGEICAKTYARYARLARMMTSLAETGEADLSSSPVTSPRYAVSAEAAEVVEAILGSAGVTDDARADLRAPVRHLLWYAEGRGTGPMEVDDALVMDFLVREAPETNPRSSGLVLRAVALATEWLRAHGDGSVIRDYSRLTPRGAGRRVAPAFTEAEVAAIAGAADTSTAKGLRDRAIVLVAYCTGMRGHDVLRIRLADVDWRGQRLVARQSKVHEPIACVLNGETLDALADYVLLARPECDAEEVFVSVRAPHRPLARGIGGIVDGLCERAGVEKVPGRSAHGIRRAFETTMVSRGVALETASEMMGHHGLEHDKEYIVLEPAVASVVALGIADAPVVAGAYRTRTGGDRT